jgi:membrane protease YdiL (CAAX protease family)
MNNSRIYFPLLVVGQIVLWSILLMLLPSSATITMFLKIFIWGIPILVFLREFEKVDSIKFLKLNRIPWFRLIFGATLFLILYVLFLNSWTIQLKSISFYYFLSAVIVAPIVEEIVFRGFIQQKLCVYTGLWASIGITSIIFTTYHIPVWFSRGLPITILGSAWLLFFSVCIGYFFNKSQSLWTCVSIHLIQNLIFGLLN